MDKPVEQQNREEVAQILQDIRSVMSGPNIAEDDILELSQMITEDGAIINLREVQATKRVAVPEKPLPKNSYHSQIETITRSVEHISVSSAERETDKTTTDAGLISDTCAEAISEPLKKLLKTVASPVAKEIGFRTGNSVEDLIIEMLEPKLTSWMDQHLPGIVSEIVEREIKKVIKK